MTIGSLATASYDPPRLSDAPRGNVSNAPKAVFRPASVPSHSKPNANRRVFARDSGITGVTIMQIKTSVAASVSALLLSGVYLAAVDSVPVFGQSNIPPLAAAKPVVLPPVFQQTLPNGLRIVLLEDHLQPSLSVRLAIPAGAIRDTPDKVGTADAVASLLDKGTTTRSETILASTVDALGASLDASADSDYLFVSASGLSNYAATLFDLMADITLRPIFPESEWEMHRTRTLSGITADLADPGSVASSVLARRVFGAHPYGNYETGTPETLANITAKDLQTFHAQ